MIVIGQDAIGRWAWMLVAVVTLELIESGHDLPSKNIAMIAAEIAWASAKLRGDPVRQIPSFIFPDERKRK